MIYLVFYLPKSILCVFSSPNFFHMVKDVIDFTSSLMNIFFHVL
ncbi:hypothetical protein SAMD00023519_00702 [Listeria monocytogenes]|nr:hypothetical protein SAMD00023519_00702 [Listeria monocytogenes]